MTRHTLETDLKAETSDASTSARATANYVEPRYTQLDPSERTDGTELLASPLMPHMDELLRRQPPGGRYLLLADAGMGKTAFLLNYLDRNQKRKSGDRLRIVMTSLVRPDALTKIEAEQSKNDAIAFLDAFDEDARAIDDAERRMQDIMAACGDFKHVVISCKTRFLRGHDEMVGRYAFEKIYLSPFSEEEIKDYLQRSIPWRQRKHRREALELAASMGDLATQPGLLAAVPELVAAQRNIPELFELYEFIVERWLERERAWIEPDVLRAASEKLAVSIHSRMTARGTDRIDLDDAARTVSMDMATLDAWQLTDGSLLHRDALRRFTFPHQWTLEYLFICALLHGQTWCLTMRWSDSVRRLFVSATNVMHRRQEDAALRKVLQQNFSTTGLFPLLERRQDSRRLETPEILNAAAAPGVTLLHEGPVWDPTRYVLEHHNEDSLYLCDRSSDTIFFVPTDWRRVESGAVDPEAARLFLLTRGEADGQIAALNDNRGYRSNWRLPTLDEIDLVFLLNQTTPFLPPSQYVWTGDLTTDGERIVAQIGPADGDLDARLNPIGVRTVLARGVPTIGYFVASMPPLGMHRAGKFDISFPAFLIRVSHGGAESFSTE